VFERMRVLAEGQVKREGGRTRVSGWECAACARQRKFLYSTIEYQVDIALPVHCRKTSCFAKMYRTRYQKGLCDRPLGVEITRSNHYPGLTLWDPGLKLCVPRWGTSRSKPPD